jgi:hypothetical protein
VARFRADSVYLRSSLVGRQLDLRHLTGRYADGEVSLLGRLDASNRDSMIASVDADLEGVKVNRFLYTFQDFNQALLTHEQVRGRLSGQLSYRDVLPPDFKPSFQHTLASLHNLRIQDGVLWNFEPLQRLSPFIQPEYTDTVDFDLSAPYMYWRDEALQVPQIQLRSSILNAIIQGRHRLDSQIDYTLMVSPVRQNYPIFETRLRDLFFGPPHESLLNFRITGHAQDYKIHYDFERSSQNFLEKLFR